MWVWLIGDWGLATPPITFGGTERQNFSKATERDEPLPLHWVLKLSVLKICSNTQSICASVVYRYTVYQRVVVRISISPDIRRSILGICFSLAFIQYSFELLPTSTHLPTTLSIQERFSNPQQFCFPSFRTISDQWCAKKSPLYSHESAFPKESQFHPPEGGIQNVIHGPEDTTHQRIEFLCRLSGIINFELALQPRR